VKEKRALMMEFVHEYGAGVRQSTCRNKTTKHEPGTLPLALSSATRKDLDQNTTSFIESVGALPMPAANNSGTNAAPRAEVKHRAGDFVAVLPGGSQRDKHAASGNIWYGKLTKDVVHIHQQVPKKPGSTKFKMISTAQDQHLSMRWLEISGIQLEAGTLYEWDDGGHAGLGRVDETCPQISLLCIVDFSVEDCTDHDGMHRYLLQQEEAGRVKNCSLAIDDSSDSDSSDSSDGVEDDCVVDVVVQQVGFVQLQLFVHRLL